MKFKIGDKVRLIDNDLGSVNKVGDVGAIVEVNKEYRVQVKGRYDRYNWSKETDLELVEEVKTEDKFKTTSLLVIESGNFEVTKINNTHIHIKTDTDSLDVNLDEVDTLCKILQQLKEDL